MTSAKKPVVQAIFKRDLRSWFGNPTGYVFITLFVFLAAIALIGPVEFFQRNLANLDTLNEWFCVLLLFFIPAVTMGIWASERSNGTDELLFTLPATDGQILLGKFLAAAGVYTTALLFTFSLPLGLSFLGSPDFGLMLANYIGYWMLGIMLISVAMLGSQLTQNLTVSFILGALFCALVVFADAIVGIVSPSLGRMVETYGPNALFQQMGRGVVSLAAILLFAGLTCAFLSLNLAILSRRNWAAGEQRIHGGLRFVALLVAAWSLSVFGINQLPRVDTTSEQLHSLSDETEQLVSDLDAARPIYIQAFISEDVPREYVQTRRTILDLLRQYDAIGGSAVHVRVVPTERYSEVAREAEENFGIRSQTEISEEGSRIRKYDVFAGLAFQCGTEEVVIPFVGRKQPVEYEITRSIRTVANTKRRKVGVLKTDVEMFGRFDFQSMRSIPQWEIVNELRLQYEVETINPDEDYPGDMDVLIAPMASSLTQPQMDRLKAHVDGGGATLLIDDPHPHSAPGTSPSDPKGGPRNPMMGQQQPPPEQKGDFRSFLEGINIAWDHEKIVWQQYNPHPELELSGPEIVFVSRGPGAERPFNEEEQITAGLQEVVTIFGGHVTKVREDSPFRFTPLLRTGMLSGTVDKREAFAWSPFGGQSLNPNRRLTRSMTEKALACRVSGKSNAQAGKDVNAIFVADLDMVGSMFFEIRRRGFGGSKIEFDNVTFILNCVDELAGDRSFIEVRKRRPKHRTLTRIAAQQQDYNKEWLTEKALAEDRAGEELAAAQKRLDDRIAEVRENLELDERSKKIQIETVREIEQRRLDLAKARIEDEKQRAIDLAKASKLQQQNSIQAWYTTVTLAGTPIPALLVAFWIFLRRRRREREIVPGSRYTGGAS